MVIRLNGTTTDNSMNIVIKKGDAVIRFAGKDDIPVIMELIRGLAEYERLSDMVTASEDGLSRCLFTDKLAEALVSEYQETPAGFALFFRTFSTFLGKGGVYIEDIFVKPEFRGRGLGTLLFNAIAGIARDRDCGRLEWACLDWNAPSIAFYKSLGAVPLDEWTTYRLTSDGIAALALRGVEGRP